MVVVELTVTAFANEPVTVHFPNFCAAVEKEIVCATVLIDANSPNVLFPVTVNVLVPVTPPITSLW